MISTILVALDHSDRAAGVLRVATEIADRFDARMRLLRAIAIPQNYPPSAHVNHDDPLPAYLKLEARTQLEEMARGNERAMRDPPIIVVGTPEHAILDVADQLHPDLIVIGSHGFGGLDHLFGTTAAHVANKARHNVLVVHQA